MWDSEPTRASSIHSRFLLNSPLLRGGETIMRAAVTALLLTALAGPAAAQVATGMVDNPRPDQLRFRELYEELVETNTTLSAGSCTEAAEKMGARLKAAGLPAENVHVLVESEHPKEGALVAIYPGTSRTAKP